MGRSLHRLPFSQDTVDEFSPLEIFWVRSPRSLLHHSFVTFCWKANFLKTRPWEHIVEQQASHL